MEGSHCVTRDMTKNNRTWKIKASNPCWYFFKLCLQHTCCRSRCGQQVSGIWVQAAGAVWQMPRLPGTHSPFNNSNRHPADYPASVWSVWLLKEVEQPALCQPDACWELVTVWCHTVLWQSTSKVPAAVENAKGCLHFSGHVLPTPEAVFDTDSSQYLAWGTRATFSAAWKPGWRPDSHWWCSIGQSWSLCQVWCLQHHRTAHQQSGGCTACSGETASLVSNKQHFEVYHIQFQASLEVRYMLKPPLLLQLSLKCSSSSGTGFQYHLVFSVTKCGNSH